MNKNFIDLSVQSIPQNQMYKYNNHPIKMQVLNKMIVLDLLKNPNNKKFNQLLNYLKINNYHNILVKKLRINQ